VLQNAASWGRCCILGGSGGFPHPNHLRAPASFLHPAVPFLLPGRGRAPAAERPSRTAGGRRERPAPDTEDAPPCLATDSASALLPPPSGLARAAPERPASRRGLQSRRRSCEVRWIEVAAAPSPAPSLLLHLHPRSRSPTARSAGRYMAALSRSSLFSSPSALFPCCRSRAVELEVEPPPLLELHLPAGANSCCRMREGDGRVTGSAPLPIFSLFSSRRP
jgi:hypothetical protein